MKLLVVSQYYHPEPFRITDICEELVRRGHTVDVLTSLPNIPGGRFYEGYGWFKKGEKQHNGVGIERVRVVRRGKGGAVRLVLNCASFAVNSLFHIGKLSKNGYDAVFVFNNSPITKLIPANRFAKKNNIPNIVFLLDIWPQSMFFLLGIKDTGKRGLIKKAAYRFCRNLYNKASLILISSKGFSGKLREMGVNVKTSYFPNYAEEFKSANDAAAKELVLPEDSFIVGFFGNVGRAQALERTVEISKKMGKKLHWLIVGDGGSLQTLKDTANENAVMDSYTFTGRVDPEEVNGYIKRCDAVFLPLEDHEVLNLTVPAKLQTYMYASKPVIAFLNGAGAEVVREAECGVAAKAGDIEDLYRAITEIMSVDEKTLLKMGENGRRYCEENFSRDKLIDKLIDEIEHEIERKTAK
jgi:colanic acid biosynthesis glycosyl transferase WcaI